jgi:lipopolysaccharide transport system ATP-binding protein
LSVAIKVEDLSKQYRLGAVGTGAIKDDIKRWRYRMMGKADPFLTVGEENDRTTTSKSDYVWALKDINFEVKQGEVLGLIGRNGAGKSTLLKILSRTTTPTTGRVKVRGRIASLLEVGTGFHGELSGRENIFLNGAIMGMTKSEIKSRLDEIIDFSGVEKYIDTPVKRYSSGMYVRLAFGVAAHLEPDIMIVDEVLAVGDAEFQKKALGKMKDVSSKQGRTVLFVSHNMGAIRGLCEKAISMKYGRIDKIGEVNSVIGEYLTNPSAVFNDIPKDSNDRIILESVYLKNSLGVATQNHKRGEDLVIEINYTATQKYEQPHFWISIYSQFGALFGANMLIDGKTPDFIEGSGTLLCRFKSLPLMPQSYSVWIGIRDKNGRENLIQSKEVGFFNIVNKVGLVDDEESEHAQILATTSCPVLINYEWQMPDGSIIPANFIK